MCVPQEVNDDIGKIYLPAGSYEVKGQQALSYVRLRHELSENGDIGRMRRQQAFLASMANKAISAGTLVNPVRLYNFLDAATTSLTTDPGLASLQRLGGLAKQLKDIGLDKIQFLSIPFETYEPDPNRLQIAPAAEDIWTKLREDEALNRRQSLGITSAAQDRRRGQARQARQARRVRLAVRGRGSVDQQARGGRGGGPGPGRGRERALRLSRTSPAGERPLSGRLDRRFTGDYCPGLAVTNLLSDTGRRRSRRWGGPAVRAKRG